ncbi:MAG: TonB-dependent receptor plug domain-containing protein, partial [Bacteroidota bacterium]
VFSYVGFEPQEVSVGSRTTIDITLGGATELQEVVVTGSAVGKSRKTLSFSVGKIDEELLSEVPAATLGNGLQGKVAGLRVNNVSGQPGAGTFFQIRSANSIANGQQPLIIVDGVFLNGSTLADINSEDVESIEVLKGSAAASLYGSQAANGVIQIFTKRGKGVGLGQTQVTYRGEFGFAEEVNRYDINNFTERDVNPDGTLSAGPSANGIHDTPLPNLQDYQEQHLFRRGSFSSNFIGIQGRSETTGFSFSGQRLNDEGVIQTTDGYQRTSFRLNIDHSLNDKTDIQVSTMYSTSEQDLLAPFSNGPSSFIATNLQLTPMFDLTAPNEEDGSPFDWDVDNTGLATTNPLYDRANSRQTVNRTRIMGNFKINRDITDWLSVNYNVSLDRSTNEYEQFLKKGYLSNNIPGLFGVNGSVGTNVVNDAGTVTGQSNGGGIHRTRRVRNFITQRANIVAVKQFGDWNTAFRGSFLYEELKNDYNEGIGENLAVDGIRSLDNAQTNVFVASNSEIVVANSFFLIADIDYKQKYIFSGLVRTEGSSLFGPDERWNNFYRASGAYRITEDFAIPGFQELKVRASIGTAGIRPTYEQRFETFTLQNGTATKNTLGNEALAPALSTEIEVGFDAAFGNAFNLEFNYSNITTEDQILRVPLSGAAGFTGQWRNAGTIEADVFEAALNIDAGKLLNFNNVTWNVGATFDRV